MFWASDDQYEGLPAGGLHRKDLPRVRDQAGHDCGQGHNHQDQAEPVGQGQSGGVRRSGRDVHDWQARHDGILRLVKCEVVT